MHVNISTQNTVMKLYSYLLQYQSKATFIMYTLYFCLLFLSDFLFYIFSCIFPIYVAQQRKL